MNKYNREEKLKLNNKIYVTDEIYKLLRQEKKKQKLSMAKIVCNLVIEIYGEKNLSNLQ